MNICFDGWVVRVLNLLVFGIVLYEYGFIFCWLGNVIIIDVNGVINWYYNYKFKRFKMMFYNYYNIY